VFQVEILFMGRWCPVGPARLTKGDAEWSIAGWRQAHGSDGRDTGFRVVETSGSGYEYPVYFAGDWLMCEVYKTQAEADARCKELRDAGVPHSNVGPIGLAPSADSSEEAKP
jgi:hypothetical protein